MDDQREFQNGMEKKEKGRNLAGPVLDYDVAIFANGTSLLRESLGRSGVGLGVEVVLLVRHRCTVVCPSSISGPCSVLLSRSHTHSPQCPLTEDDEAIRSNIPDFFRGTNSKLREMKSWPLDFSLPHSNRRFVPLFPCMAFFFFNIRIALYFCFPKRPTRKRI